MKRLLRYWFRRRFVKALDKADWRTSTFPDHPEAGWEVAMLRSQPQPVDLNAPQAVTYLIPGKTKPVLEEQTGWDGGMGS